MKQRFLLFPIVLMVVGVVARLYVIVYAGSFWFDESATFSFAKLPIFQSWQYLKYENNPPLYYWVAHFWGLLFGFSEISLRSPSVIFGILTMFAIIRLGRELFNKHVGLWAGAIYAVASFSIFLDTEARMYSLLSLCIVLSYIYFLKILFKSPTRLDIFLYVFITTLALYTNLTGLWAPITQFIILLFIQPKEMARLKAMTCVIVPALLFLPWFIAFAIERIAFSKIISTGSWWYFATDIPFFMLFLEPPYFFSFWSAGVNIVMTAISFVVSMGIIGWFLQYSWKQRKLFENKIMVVALGLIVPLIFPVDISSPRYFYQSAIFFWIIMAYLIFKAFEHINSKILFGVLVMMIAGYAFINLEFPFKDSFHDNWDVAARWIDAQHADVVLALPKLWATEIYDPSTPFYFLPPPVASLQNMPLDPFQMVTRYNYNWGSGDYQLNSMQDTFLYRELAIATASSSKIIFGYQGGSTQKTIFNDLEELGFEPQSDFLVKGYDVETITVFERSMIQGIH